MIVKVSLMGWVGSRCPFTVMKESFHKRNLSTAEPFSHITISGLKGVWLMGATLHHAHHNAPPLTVYARLWTYPSQTTCGSPFSLTCVHVGGLPLDHAYFYSLSVRSEKGSELQGLKYALISPFFTESVQVFFCYRKRWFVDHNICIIKPNRTEGKKSMHHILNHPLSYSS